MNYLNGSATINRSKDETKKHVKVVINALGKSKKPKPMMLTFQRLANFASRICGGAIMAMKHAR